MKRTSLPVKPDFKDALEDGKWSRQMVRDLSRYIEALGNFLRDLPDMFVEEVTFLAGATPTKDIGVDKTPAGIVPLAFDNVTTGASAAMAAPLEWSYSGGVITFTSLAGIAGTDSYRFRFLVVEG